jgi:hypothetical protein
VYGLLVHGDEFLLAANKGCVREAAAAGTLGTLDAANTIGLGRGGQVGAAELLARVRSRWAARAGAPAVGADYEAIPGLRIGWQGRVADSNRGWVWQRPGASGNADMLRVMDPTSRYPNGYARFYNDRGQPLGMDARPGTMDETHFPRDPESGLWSVPEGWGE